MKGVPRQRKKCWSQDVEMTIVPFRRFRDSPPAPIFARNLDIRRPYQSERRRSYSFGPNVNWYAI